jgi:hypothetical protein
MPGWLNKASSVFRRSTPDVEHPFAVPCECGLIHRGMRRNRSQKIVCRECGAPRFILPKDVYPAPRDRPKEPPPPPPSLPVLNPVKESPGKKGKPAPAAARPDKLNPKIARDAAPEFFVVPARGKLLTPFRVVVLSIAAVSLVTSFFIVQKVRRDKATTALREATDNAWAAVENGDWAKSREQFTLAVTAAGTLGLRDSAAHRLESGLKESRAIEQLCPRPLIEILAEAESMSADQDKWKRHFATHYEGRWLVFDGPVALKNEGWQVEFPIKIGKRGRPVRVLIKSSGLDGVKETEGQRGVILAARLSTVELNEKKTAWNVAFEPESGFLWSLPETFTALGIDGDEFRTPAQTKDVLAKQAEWNGIPPEVSQ